MAAHGYSAELVAKGNAILNYDPSATGPKTVLQDMIALLWAEKKCYLVTPSPREVMVHPDNRGRLMLHPIDCHTKGARIMDIGVGTPNGGVAFELCPMSGPLRDNAIAKNEQLVSKSNQLLSELTGAERFLSLATTHCWKFARAVLTGQPTPIQSLQDEHGKLNAALLCSRDTKMNR